MLKSTRFACSRKDAVTLAETCYFLQRTVVSTSSKNNTSKVSNLKKYWFVRFVDYVKNYEKVLEKNFPRTMGLYRIFSGGTKAFYIDLKKYISVIRKQSTKGVNNLASDELKLNYTLPRDIAKISPVLLISAVPFTNYVIFPLAYYFPRHLLTTHYWTPQQRIDFRILEHKRRIKHNKPLYKCMQDISKIREPRLRNKWNDVIACLGSGSHPSASEIIYCSELFGDKPFGLYYLRGKHARELLGIHGMAIWRPFRRDRLMERGMLIKRMDKAIQKEGGVANMSEDAIKWAISFRGLNSTNMSIESMREWLDKWLIISETISENTMSLLLHCPILLAYNDSNNVTLIYK